MTAEAKSGTLKTTRPVAHCRRQPGDEEGRPQVVARRRWLVLPLLLCAATASAQSEVNGYKLEGPSDRFALGTDPAQKRGAKPAIVLRAKDGDGEGSIVKSIKANLYRGKKVRLTGWLKANGASSAALFLRVRDANGKSLAADEMKDRVAGDTEWSQYTLTIAVPRDAASIEYGAQLGGKGTIWVDNLQLVAVK